MFEPTLATAVMHRVAAAIPALRAVETDVHGGHCAAPQPAAAPARLAAEPGECISRALDYGAVGDDPQERAASLAANCRQTTPAVVLCAPRLSISLSLSVCLYVSPSSSAGTAVVQKLLWARTVPHPIPFH